MDLVEGFSVQPAMPDHSQHVASALPDTLIVSDQSDVLVDKVEQHARATGAGAERVADVYLGMARLAAAPAGQFARVIVDTRGLDAAEERFMSLARQMSRDAEVIDLQTALEALREPVAPRGHEGVERIDSPSSWRWAAPAAPPPALPETPAPEPAEPPRIVARIGPDGVNPAAPAEAAAAPTACPEDDTTLHEAVRRRMRTAAAEAGATLAAVHRIPPAEPAAAAPPPEPQPDKAAPGALLSREELDQLLGRLEADLKEMGL